MASVTTDEAFLARALELAERGRGTTRPNPMVGAVVVRAGEVVGEGWHERVGGPHAEIVALRAAGERARGATVYTTLEPCDHVGRTGPCTLALIDAGVGRVVFAVADPDVAAAGGADRLRAAGVDVVGGLLAERAEQQNVAFLHRHRTGRPFVTLKLAQTLDGRGAAADGTSQWITGPVARQAGHALRAEVDAVVVGSGTVLTDDPELTVRLVPVVAAHPRPVILDARGRTPPGAQVVRAGAVIVSTDRSDPAWRSAIAERGAEVVLVAPASDGGVDPDATLRELASRHVHALLVEGGPTVADAFIHAGLVDRLVLHIAPLMLGTTGLPAVATLGPATLAEAQRWQLEGVRVLGDDVEIVAVPASVAG